MKRYALVAGAWREVVETGGAYLVIVGGRVGFIMARRAWLRRLAEGTAREVSDREAA